MHYSTHHGLCPVKRLNEVLYHAAQLADVVYLLKLISYLCLAQKCDIWFPRGKGCPHMLNRVTARHSRQI
jgi:hypothetical protein